MPGDTSLVYYGAHRLLATRDRGNTWQAVSPDLTTNPADWRKIPLGAGFSTRESLSRDDGITNYATITTIGVSQKAPGTVYVGTDDGQVQLTTDGGTRGTNITSRFRMPAPRWVGRVQPSRIDARVAYAVFDGHNDDDLTPYVFRSSDGGATWVSIAGDMPNGTVARTIEEHPRNPNVLFLGTEFGLYWTFDGGRHWTRATGNLPPVRVDRVILNDETNDLIVATHGRGIIVLDDVSPLEHAGAGVVAGDLTLLPPRAATATYEWRDLPWPSANAFVAPNPPVGTSITYVVGEAAAVVSASNGSLSRTRTPPTAKIQIVAPDGQVVRRLGGSGTRAASCPGTSRERPFLLRVRFRLLRDVPRSIHSARSLHREARAGRQGTDADCGRSSERSGGHDSGRAGGASHHVGADYGAGRHLLVCGQGFRGSGGRSESGVGGAQGDA